MRLYLDEDSAAAVLAKLLRQAGHDVQTHQEAELAGEPDAVHLRHAIHEARVLLSRNYRDFEDLHNLIGEAGGRHPGMLIVRQDNDPAREMSPRGIVRAIGNLIRAGVPLADTLQILNHWR